MPASEAQVRANQANSKLYTGPKTDQGKERSRANALKHGLTGAGIVMPAADAAEVEGRAVAIAAETNASGVVGHALARIAALNSVRIERGADQQAAALSGHVRRVDADFVPPEDADDATAARLRDEAIRIAMFDPSREATLARTYQAAAERGFLRALTELRRLEKQARANPPGMDEAAFEKVMASFSQINQQMDRRLDDLEVKYPEGPEPAPKIRLEPSRRFDPLDLSPDRPGFDVPISIGKRR